MKKSKNKKYPNQKIGDKTMAHKFSLNQRVTPEDIEKVCRHKVITFIPHHACALCGEFTGWYLFGRWPGMEVAYSSSCGCSYPVFAHPESWNDIFKWVTDEHGELKPEYKDLLTE